MGYNPLGCVVQALPESFLPDLGGGDSSPRAIVPIGTSPPSLASPREHFPRCAPRTQDGGRGAGALTHAAMAQATRRPPKTSTSRRTPGGKAGCRTGTGALAAVYTAVYGCCVGHPPKCCAMLAAVVRDSHSARTGCCVVLATPLNCLLCKRVCPCSAALECSFLPIPADLLKLGAFSAYIRALGQSRRPPVRAISSRTAAVRSSFVRRHNNWFREAAAPPLTISPLRHVIHCSVRPQSGRSTGRRRRPARSAEWWTASHSPVSCPLNPNHGDIGYLLAHTPCSLLCNERSLISACGGPDHADIEAHVAAVAAAGEVVGSVLSGRPSRLFTPNRGHGPLPSDSRPAASLLAVFLLLLAAGPTACCRRTGTNLGGRTCSW